MSDDDHEDDDHEDDDHEDDGKPRITLGKTKNCPGENPWGRTKIRNLPVKKGRYSSHIEKTKLTDNIDHVRRTHVVR